MINLSTERRHTVKFFGPEGQRYDPVLETDPQLFFCLLGERNVGLKFANLPILSTKAMGFRLMKVGQDSSKALFSCREIRKNVLYY
jgi:hypothetical protein